MCRLCSRTRKLDSQLPWQPWAGNGGARSQPSRTRSFSVAAAWVRHMFILWWRARAPLVAHPHYSRERLAGAESLMQILTLPRGFSLGLPGFSPFFLLPRHFHLPLLTTSLRISCSRTSRTNNSHMLTVPPVPAVAQDWAKYMYVCTNGSASLLKCWSMQVDIEKHVLQVLYFVIFFFFHFNRLEDGSLIYETLEAFSSRDP